MTIPLRLEQLTPDEADFQRWKSAQGLSTPDDADFEAWKKKQGLALSRAPSESTRALARSRPSPTGDFDALRSLPTAAMGAEASLARGLPPIAALQNAARALARGQSYGEAKSDIDQATGMLNPTVRGVIQGVGAAPAMMLMPAATIPQAMASGATVGAMSGMDDPTLSAGDRAKGMAVGAGTGAAIAGGLATGAKAFDAGRGLLRNAQRASEAPTIGQTSLSNADDIKALDRTNFGEARSQAQTAGGSSPAVRDMMNDPDIAPHAADIRESFRRQGKPTDDASVLMQLRSELSQKQGPIINKITNTPNGSNVRLSERQSADIQAIKDKIVSALSDTRTVEKPPIMFDVPGTHVSTEPKPPIHFDVPETTAGNKPITFNAPAEVHSGGGSVTQVPRTLREALARFNEGLPAENLRTIRTPNVDIETPAMRVQTVPGAQVHTAGMRVQTAPAEPGMELMASPMRVQTAPGETVTEPALAPGLRPAVDESATARQQRQAGQTVSAATRRLMRNGATNIPDNKLDQQSPEAVARAVKQMTPEQAQEALQWLFGRAKEIKATPTLNPKTGFGVGKAAAQLNRLSPLIDQLDTQAGNPVRQPMDIQTMLRLMGAAQAGTP